MVVAILVTAIVVAAAIAVVMLPLAVLVLLLVAIAMAASLLCIQSPATSYSNINDDTSKYYGSSSSDIVAVPVLAPALTTL
jgi:hypothetical protein